MTTHYDALETLPENANHLNYRPDLPDISMGSWWAKDSKFATRMSYSEADRIIREHIGPRGHMLLIEPLAEPNAQWIVVIEDDHEYYHLPNLYLA